MGKLRKKFQQIINIPWIPRMISILAAVGYIVQIWIYAHSQDSILDDGLYMLKGYLFATGKYRPFEPFGPWTNKMPLSFLIPGYVQKIFGPGLRVGRYYAIGVAIIFFIGVWIVSRRLGGIWGATLAVSIIVLNPPSLKLYSMALSEGLIASMLVWVLVLVLGKGRPLWQLLLGSFLAGLIPITRINMSPVLPFVLGYIFWEHGLQAGIYSALASVFSFVGGHIIYWPGIMRLWSPWFPAGLTPFLDRWRFDFGDAQSIHSVSRSFKERYMSFFEGLRYHFSAIMGTVTSWVLWPEKWKEESRFRISVFLSSLFTVLLIIHAYASLLKNFNVFAFSVYVSFFEILGILFLITSISHWKITQPVIKKVGIYIMMLLISIGVFFSYTGKNTFWGRQVGFILSQKAVQIQDGKIIRAPWQIWEMIHGRLGWSYRTSFFIFSILSLLAIEILIVGIIVWLVKRKGQIDMRGRFPSIVLIAFLSISILLSPTPILGGEMHNFSCHPGVIAEHERAADTLIQYIEDGDRVVWIGSNTQSVLLEIMDSKEIFLYPQQLNSQYSYRLGGDSAYLARHGYWNDELEQKWLGDSDIVLVERSAVEGWHRDFDLERDLEDYIKVGETSQIGCFGDKKLTIYKKFPSLEP